MVLPATMRIRGHRCFDRLHRSGKGFQGKWMVLRVVSSLQRLMKSPQRDQQPSCCRCAVVISSKVSKRAVVRNRLRRLLHNHLRLKLEDVNAHAGRWALLSLRPGSAAAEPATLLEECDRLLMDAGLL
ncbi:MAG: ribonuclease P protein component [Prochlorococcus sp.]|nr:ribonuclease P protein component [Prochlorococcaceae cyanobacterium Fu_MAG_50]